MVPWMLLVPIAGFLGYSFLTKEEQTQEATAFFAMIIVVIATIYITVRSGIFKIVLLGTKSYVLAALIPTIIAGMLGFGTYFMVKSTFESSKPSIWEYSTISEQIEKSETVRKIIIIGIVVLCIAAMILWGDKK